MGFVSEVIDCSGPGFDGAWGPLFDLSSEVFGGGVAAAPGRTSKIAPQAIAGAEPLAPAALPRRLLEVAAQVRQRFTNLSVRALGLLAQVLSGFLQPHHLSGFCVHGFITALFWSCLDVSPDDLSSEVAACLRGLVSGPIDTWEWGPLEFSQSSRWPVKMVDIRLLLEHWETCADVPVRECPSTSSFELALAHHIRRAPPSVLDSAAGALEAQLVAGPPFRAVWWLPVDDPASQVPRPLRLVVVGSHLGSNMEPLSLVYASAQEVAIDVQAVVYGTQYPFPDLICELFGQCLRNAFLDVVVGKLVKQMYEPTWELAELLEPLQQALEQDEYMLSMDLLLCAQPMAVCSLLRGLSEAPMLLYQAFPLIGATPAAHQHLMLLHFREMFRLPRRSAFVVYSEFLASQFEYQVGQRPLCVRPHSLYASQSALYDPDREDPRVAVARMAGWARDGAHAVVQLIRELSERDLRPGTRLRFVFLGAKMQPTETVGGLERPFGYAELRRYRAAVFIPWDMGMLLFSEFYNMGVPLLVPDRAWMATLIKRSLEYTDFGWWQARANTAVSLPGHHGDVPWPWFNENSSLGHILGLYDQTDFVRWPYVAEFESFPALMTQLRSLDFDSSSAAMLRWGAAALPHSLSVFSSALSSLLSGGEPPPLGASSCV